MSFEDQLRETVASAVAPLLAEIRQLKDEQRTLVKRLPPALGSKADAAKAMGVCVRTVDKMIRDGDIKAARRGGRWIVDMTSLHVDGAGGRR